MSPHSSRAATSWAEVDKCQSGRWQVAMIVRGHPANRCHYDYLMVSARMSLNDGCSVAIRPPTHTGGGQ